MIAVVQAMFFGLRSLLIGYVVGDDEWCASSPAEILGVSIYCSMLEGYLLL